MPTKSVWGGSTARCGSGTISWLAAVDVLIPSKSGAAVMGVARKTVRPASSAEGASIRDATMV